jgi:hypothetical protein
MELSVNVAEHRQQGRPESIPGLPFDQPVDSASAG